LGTHCPVRKSQVEPVGQSAGLVHLGGGGGGGGGGGLTHRPLMHTAGAMHFTVAHGSVEGTHWPPAEASPGGPALAAVRVGGGGPRKPSWRRMSGGQSALVMHLPPPPPGMQKPNRQEVPGGHGSPF